MHKFTVTLPKKQHNGKSNITTINRIKRQVAILAGGYTSMSVDGGWYDDATEQFYKDSSVLLTTYVGSTDTLNILEARVYDWGLELQQISMCYEVLREHEDAEHVWHVLEVNFIECTREQDLAS